MEDCVLVITTSKDKCLALVMVKDKHEHRNLSIHTLLLHSPEI